MDKWLILVILGYVLGVFRGLKFVKILYEIRKYIFIIVVNNYIIY